MRVLWFSNTRSLYEQGKHVYQGGGWIESLEGLVRIQPAIDLAVAFFHPSDTKKALRNSTTYYPIHRPRARRHPLRALIRNWSGRLPTEDYTNAFSSIVDDFKPDVIQVFGTEGPFTEVQSCTNVPVVVHIQGLVNPLLDAYFPPGHSRARFLASVPFFLNNLLGNSPAFHVKRFAQQAAREAIMLRNAQYVMGRTHWDKLIASLYNPNVVYFHVDEVLRLPFYQAHSAFSSHSEAPFALVSTLSPTVYKGIDVLLRSAASLKQHWQRQFEWRVAGIGAKDPLLQYFEKATGISHKQVNVICEGQISAEELVALLSRSDVFVHPSYIENSANSVCEAQMLGLPVVACDVGGLSSLIANKQNGFLVPANGVFEMVDQIRKIAEKRVDVDAIQRQARASAYKRHDQETIVANLIQAYLFITSK